MLDGRVEEAKLLALQALDIVRTRKERGHEAWTLWLLGEIVAQREPPDIERAATHYRHALALAEALGMRPLQAHCHHGLGTLYTKRGQRGAGPYCVVHCDWTLPGHADDLLGAPGGGGAGAGGSALTMEAQSPGLVRLKCKTSKKRLRRALVAVNQRRRQVPNERRLPDL